MVKQSIDELITAYSDVKVMFFMNASKEGYAEAERDAASAYTMLISILRSLLDKVMPDNVGYLDEIVKTEVYLEELDKRQNISDEEVNSLRQLCAWADTTILRPHLKTQLNRAPCVHRARTSPLINISYHGPQTTDSK
jgi:hypothetical protein